MTQPYGQPGQPGESGPVYPTQSAPVPPGGPLGQPAPLPPEPVVRPGAGPEGPDAARATPTSDPEADDLRRVRHSRAGQWWAALAVGTILLVALVVFIAQNSANVPIHFLGFAGHFPLALALLIAAAGGAAIALVLGTLRIVQLRRALKRSAGRRHTEAGAR